MSVALFMWIMIQKYIIIQSSVRLIKYFASMYLMSACEDGDVRLRGGSHYREGRVEVCRNQQWGRVCDDHWDENEFAIVCKQLGLSEEGTFSQSQ